MPLILADPAIADVYVDIADKLATEVYVRTYNKKMLVIEEEPEEAAESFSV